MKIGFDAKRLFNNFTGLGNYSRTLLRNLKKYYPEEYQYHLYSPKIKDSEITRKFSSTDQYTTHQPRSFNPFWRSKGITRDLVSDGIQVFHGLSHQLPQEISRTPIKTVVTVHDLIHRIFPETYPLFDRKIYDFRLKRALAEADQIVAISQQTKKDILSYFNVAPSKVKVVYQCCDPVYYQLEDKIQETRTFDSLPSEYLLYVGSLTPRKNLIDLVRAYRKLDAHDQIPLVFVGKGGKKYTSLLKQEAQKSGVLDKLIFLPNISKTVDLKYIYQKSKGLLYPSWYEGFGIPIIEAALCKTPVLTSETSSMPEAAGPHCTFVDPFDIDSMTDGISRLLVTDQSTIENTYKYALELFDEQRCTRQVMDIYQSLIQH